MAGEVNYSIGIFIGHSIQDAASRQPAVPDPRRIAQLAGQAAVFQAQRWFARERNWINDQQLQLCRIAAPTFFEQQRAEWFRDRLSSLGWEARSIGRAMCWLRGGRKVNRLR